MSRKTRMIRLLVTMAVWAANPGVSESFNDNAHKLLTSRAINPTLTNASTLDSFLKNVLPFEFSQGINEALLGGQDGTVQGQIRVGAVNEDQGSRPLQHFHDPTKPWGSAGLSIFPFTSFQSSVRWSQNTAQSPGDATPGMMHETLILMH